METIEIVGFVFWKQRGDQRIHDGLGNAVANRKEKHTPEQTLKRQRLPTGCECCARCQRERGRHEVHDKCREHEWTKADAISDQAGK